MSQQPSPSSGPPEPLSDIFLSPRVIDRTAFEQFTAQLNELIAQAQRHGTMLECATSDAGAVEAQLRQTASELELKAERVAGVIPTIDDRLAQIEHLLQEAVTSAADPDRIRDHTNRLVAARLETLDDDMRDMLREVRDHVSHTGSSTLRLEPDPHPSVKHVARLHERLDAIETRLDELSDRTLAAPDADDLRALGDQAHEARDLLARAVLAASARIDAMDDQCGALIDSLGAFISESRRRAELVHAQRDAAQKSAGEAIENLDQITRDASQQLSMILASVAERERAGRMLAEDLSRLILALENWKEQTAGQQG
ncbi:MAG: hypothetical protein IIB55_07200 [Planctomycetes bacterium]|nr:hypothetical protein [Planctomycetota bacterium]